MGTGVRLFRVSLFCGLMSASSAAWSVADCQVSATGLNFGSYDTLSAGPLDGTGDIQVSCSLLGVLSLLVSYTIELNAGVSGNFSGRIMQGSSDDLAYQLYANPVRTSVWGDGAGGTVTVSDGYTLGLLTTTRTYTMYGRIPGSQNVPAGNYSDTIVVTLNF